MDFIEIYDDVLSADVCQRLRMQFEESDLAHPGVTGHGVEPDKKISSDIVLNQHPLFADLLQEVTEATRQGMLRYFHKYHFALIAPLALTVRHRTTHEPVKLTHDNYWDVVGSQPEDKPSLMEENFMRTLYRVGPIQAQKYDKGLGNYNYWHCEVYPQKGTTEALHRTLLFMFYLNDVEQGGETDFYYQERSIQPKQGRMVIAPAYFTHTHRGRVPVSADKYILTSWVLFNQETQLFR